jgi:hypothetical protein
MNRDATIVFTPTRLVPLLIPDQPRTGLHRIATACLTGTAISVTLGCSLARERVRERTRPLS